MKRFLAIPLFVLYMLSVSGMLIHLHYCGMNLASWDIYRTSEGCGGACSSSSPGKETPPCCHDKLIIVKVSDDHSHSFYQHKFLAVDDFDLYPATLPGVFRFVPKSDLKDSILKGSVQAQAPPGIWQHIPLYLLHSSPVYYS